MIREKLAELKLPDLFLALDGTRVSQKEEWESKMRPYWREILQKEEYGRIPPRLTPSVSSKTNAVDFAGKAVWETVSFAFTLGGRTHTVPTQLIYPRGAKNIPFFIYINFRPDIPDRYLPVEEIIDNNFGIFSVCYNDITTDDGDFTNGLAGIFSGEQRLPESAGKIMYWSYMASRMMDYLQTRKEANPKAIGVGGHSRLGKTALLTAAMDERFAFVCSNNSGCSGAALSRGANEGGERISDIYARFPYWFCPNYEKYVEETDSMPFDQHALLALIAPRTVLVGAALDDVWADNTNQFLCCCAASPAWELYGRRGIVTPDALPICGDELIEGNVGFHLRAGKHFHSRTDWLVYMKAAERFREVK